MKIKKKYVCRECGYISATWIGKCPECLKWNSLEEEIVEKPLHNKLFKSEYELTNINQLEVKEESLMKTASDEVNHFFGGGIVAGSVILITGEPGVGKSTFLLFLIKLLKEESKVLYFSGEESQLQLKKRSDRLMINHKHLYISNQNDIDLLIADCTKNKPNLVFLDSIQTCYSSKIDSSIGTISQIKYCTSQLIHYAKTHSVPVFIVGHITKSGEIAGPKVMEHLVDVVTYFEGDFNYHYRILRLMKNRFGSIDDILLFEMKEEGLKLINNPSGYFIDHDEKEGTVGKCKTVIIEGKHPIVCEVEALVVPTVYTNPRRFAEGVDVARISRIAAIMDKHLNEKFHNHDIYFNISGGIKTKDVGIDLAIALAIYSSKNKLKVDYHSLIIGELSLTGKVRKVFRLEQRIKEALKFGSQTIVTPASSQEDNQKIIKIQYINDMIKNVFA